MNKPTKKTDSDEPENQDEGLDTFLDHAAKVIEGDGEGQADGKRSPGEPQHRRLRVIVSEDRLEARFEAVFPDTTFAEAQEAVKRERVVWGIQEAGLTKALAEANRSGRRQRNVLVVDFRSSHEFMQPAGFAAFVLPIPAL